MRREIGGDGIDLFLQPFLNAIQFFGKHQMAFGDELELMLKVLRKYADVMPKVFVDFLPEIFSKLTKFIINNIRH